MGTPVKAKFYLIDPFTGKYYYLSGGSVLLSSAEVALKNSPEEWQKVDIKYSRSSKYKGVFRATSNDYSFTGDGATILRYLYYTQGTAARCILKIMLRNADTWLHTDELLNAEIAFEDIEDTRNYFKSGCLEPGIAADLTSNEGTDYEIPLDSDKVPVAVYKGAILKAQYNYQFGDTTVVEVPATGGIIGGYPNGRLFNMLVAATSNEGSLPVATSSTANPIPGMGSYSGTFMEGLTSDFHPYDNEILEIQQDIIEFTLELRADIAWEVVGMPAGVSMQFKILARIGKSNLAYRSQTAIYDGPTYTSTGATTTYLENPNLGGVSLGDGLSTERIYLLCAIVTSAPIPSGSPKYNVQITVPGAENNSIALKVDFRTLSAYQRNPDTPTDFFGFRWYQLAYKLIAKIADGKYGASPARSDYMSNPNSKAADYYPYRTIMTTGDMIRQVPDSKFKMNWDDLWKDGTSRDQIGLGIIDNQVRIENLSFFFDKNTMIIDLGEVSNLKLSVFSDGRGTSIKLGSKYDEANKLNGKDEFNTSHIYKIPGISGKSNEVDMTSPAITSMYTIIDKMLNLSYQPTTDNDTDNTLYAVSVTNDLIGTLDAAYKINYPEDNGGDVQGVYFGDTAFNVDLSPGRDRERLKGLLSSMLYPIGQAITFQTAERNDKMKSRFKSTDPYIIERDSLFPSSDSGALLFLPIVAEFDCVKPVNIRELIDTNPYGFIRFKYEGQQYDMFLDEVTIQPVDRANYQWKGRLTPNNVLANLIR